MIAKRPHLKTSPSDVGILGVSTNKSADTVLINFIFNLYGPHFLSRSAGPD